MLFCFVVGILLINILVEFIIIGFLIWGIVFVIFG